MSTITYPRLFVNSSKLETLKSQVKRDPKLSLHWVKIMERANRLLAEKFVSETYADADDSQHGNYGAPSRQMAFMGEYLGLVYHITGDPKYAHKLKEALLYYSKYQKWFGKGCLDFDPQWHSELNTAHFCFGFALGYDYLHHLLNESERQTIIKGLINLGILPILRDWLWAETRVHALDSMGHNWWSVCVAHAGLAALAISGDHPEALLWVDEVSEAFPSWFEYEGNVLQNKSRNFDRKGLFYEGINYANYGVGEYLLFRIAYINCFGNENAPEIPLLAKVGESYIQTSYPTSKGLDFVNFNDGHTLASRCARLLLAAGFESPQLRWYAVNNDDEVSPLDFINSEKIFRGPKQRPSKQKYNDGEFPDVGWAIMRSSWEDDATLLAIKSGFTWNHAHADAGSFILKHQGKRLIIDGGNCSYGRNEYLDYYCQSQAHNVILFDGKGQASSDLERGVKAPGTIHDFLQLDNIRYVYADATGPTSHLFSRNYRHILWIDNVILIIDDLLSHRLGRYDWLLHYAGRAELNGNSLKLTNQGAKAELKFLYPEALDVEEVFAPAADNPDKQQSYYSFSPKVKELEQKFITAILLNDGAKKPKIKTFITKDSVLGLSIQGADFDTKVYLNLKADGRKMHRNSSNQLGDWDTDAYLLAVTYSNGTNGDFPQVKQIFVSAASYVRLRGKTVFSCLAKASAIINNPKNQALDSIGQMAIRGHAGYPVLVRSSPNLQELEVNDEKVGFSYDKRTKLLKILIPEQT